MRKTVDSDPSLSDPLVVRPNRIRRADPGPFTGMHH